MSSAEAMKTITDQGCLQCQKTKGTRIVLSQQLSCPSSITVATTLSSILSKDACLKSCLSDALGSTLWSVMGLLCAGTIKQFSSKDLCLAFCGWATTLGLRKRPGSDGFKRESAFCWHPSRECTKEAASDCLLGHILRIAKWATEKWGILWILNLLPLGRY